MDNSDKLKQVINTLVHSSDPAEIKRTYREWANSYDTDLAKLGYIAPQLSAEIFTQLVSDRLASIYDAGCGTGLVGQLLSTAGYTYLHGADFSDSMRLLAAQTGVYSSLEHADFSQALSLPDHSHDAIISVGVYTARFNGRFLPEMIRILKPRGYMVFTCRPLYYESDVKPELEKLLREDIIGELSNSLKPYMTEENTDAHYISFRKY